VLMIRSDVPLCTGTLIHPMVVLTAGHCIRRNVGGETMYDYTSQPDALRVMGGASGEVPVGAVAALLVHPDWTGDPAVAENDVALLRLAEGAVGLEPMRLRALPGPSVGDAAVIVGYGSDMIAIPQDEALAHRQGRTTILQISDTVLEIGGEANSCAGDSGGPVLTEQDGEWVISGVISYGTNNCDVDEGGFALNVLGSCSWLDSAFSQLLGEGAAPLDCGMAPRDMGKPDETGQPGTQDCSAHPLLPAPSMTPIELLFGLGRL
jgi:hypothetical protein